MEGGPNVDVDQELLKSHLSAIELKHMSATTDVDLKNMLEEMFVQLYGFVDSSYLRGVTSFLKDKALKILQEKRKKVSWLRIYLLVGKKNHFRKKKKGTRILEYSIWRSESSPRKRQEKKNFKVGNG